MWIEAFDRDENEDGLVVTPSRVCGLKPEKLNEACPSVVVTPSRVCGLKQVGGQLIALGGRHTLAGVWIEAIRWCRNRQHRPVTPSRVCGLKPNSKRDMVATLLVTPSRVCGLKPVAFGLRDLLRRHTLAGVWIEAPLAMLSRFSLVSHTLAGVWIEARNTIGGSPPFRGVTPSRVCGLKHCRLCRPGAVQPCHTLAGVWIEA